MRDDITPNKPVQDTSVDPAKISDMNMTTPAVETDSEHMTNMNRKRLLLSSAILLMFALVGTAVWFFIYQPLLTNKDDKSLAHATYFASPQAIVDEVKPELQGAVMQSVTGTSIGVIDRNQTVIYSAPVYKQPGASFANLPEQISGTGSTGDSVVAEKNYMVLTNFFEEHKFKKLKSDKNIAGVVSGSEQGTYLSYAEYESANMLCAIRHVDASGAIAKAHIASLGCAEKASYKKAAERLQTFFDAYTDGDKSYGNDLVFGFITSGDGKDGYKYAVVYQQDAQQFEEGENFSGAFTGLYLKQPNENEWLYFKGVQGQVSDLNCSVYNDAVLKKSFSGFDCFDEAKQQAGTVL